MTDILVRPAELRQTAEQLRSHAQKIDRAIQSIDNDISSLKEHQFLGQRADAVQAHYAPKREVLLKAQQLVMHFAGELGQAAAVFEKADHGTKYERAEKGTPDENNAEKNLQEKFSEFTPPVDDRKLVTIPDDWIAELFGLQQRTVTQTESEMLDKLGLFGQKKMYDIQKEAFSMAEAFAGNNGQEDGLGDAFRHAYWNALMAREFGADWTEQYATAHEMLPGNPKTKAFMDLWNNEVGRRIAVDNPDITKQELANKVADAVRDGKMVIIDGSTQTPVFSNEGQGVENLPNPDAPST